VAALGLTVIASLMVSMQMWLALAGGAFLAWLGVRTFISAPAAQAAALRPANLLADYGSALGLTLTNPMTIFSFLAVFAGMGLAATGGDYGLALMMVLGVFLGSASWWLILSTGTALLRGRMTPNALRWVNRTAGVIITGFAVYMLAGVVVK
jgi:threonine/homoserine/homoserine lactone efflux protein